MRLMSETTVRRPEDLRFLSGVILVSTEPAIHPAVDYPGEATAAGAVKIAFMVFDLDPLVAWLAESGVELCYPPRRFGAESRITAVRDPDGNLVELTELGPAWLEHLRAHRARGGDLVAHWSARAT
jgi:catechol 2,3-dioxygenase-like lactoylglutathione lyase family enzyme